jgi:hypothetical protein
MLASPVLKSPLVGFVVSSQKFSKLIFAVKSFLTQFLNNVISIFQTLSCTVQEKLKVEILVFELENFKISQLQLLAMYKALLLK